MTVLSEVAAFGDYFDITRPAPSTAPSLRQLSGDLAAVRVEVETTAGMLAARTGVPVDRIDRRAAASTVHLGLAARIVAPVIGAVALGGEVPFATADLVLHRLASGSLVLSAGDGAGGDDVIATLTAVNDAFAAAASLSRVVLWGNAGSAVATAAAIVVRARPAAEAPARRAADALLTHPRLAPTGAYRGGAWQRRSCCLYYRIPGGGLCGDCVLAVRSPARA